MCGHEVNFCRPTGADEFIHRPLLSKLIIEPVSIKNVDSIPDPGISLQPRHILINQPADATSAAQ